MRTLPALLAWAALAVPPAAWADPAGPLPDHQLGEARGGVLTPFGYEIGFGATVRTYVDGSLALETRLTWTEGGVVVEGDPAVGGPTQAMFLPAALGGGTEIRHDLSADRIASVIINTANDRTLRQQTDVVLVVPQLADLQARALAGRTAEGLQQAVGLALSDAAR